MSDKKHTPSPYARYVKRLRLSLGLSISAMARVAGMSPSYWAQMEKGKKGPPSDATVSVAIARHFYPLIGSMTYMECLYSLEALSGRLPHDCLKKYQRNPIKVVEIIRKSGL